MSRTEFVLSKKKIPIIIGLLIESSRNGKSIDEFLWEYNIPILEWQKFIKKHKIIRTAMINAHNFSKGYALKEVGRLINDKTINSTIAKMYLEQIAGWGPKMDLEDKIRPQVTIKVGKTTRELIEIERINKIDVIKERVKALTEGKDGSK